MFVWACSLFFSVSNLVVVIYVWLSLKLDWADLVYVEGYKLVLMFFECYSPTMEAIGRLISLKVIPLSLQISWISTWCVSCSFVLLSQLNCIVVVYFEFDWFITTSIVVWNRAVVVWGVILGPNWIPHLMNSKGRITTVLEVQKLLYLKIFGPPALVIWTILLYSLVAASRLQACFLTYMMRDAQAHLNL